MHIGRYVCALLLVTTSACHAPRSAAPAPPATLIGVAPPPPPPQKTDIDSRDILARTAIASPVLVKHVLFGWAKLAPTYRGDLDPRAAKRTQAEAARLAEQVAAQLRADPTRLDALVNEHSEDPGSVRKDPYTVTTDAPFIPEFKNLAQRLAIGEVGIVTTQFGYHVVMRVAPPPPDPLESSDILARPAGAGPVDIQHILIGWTGLDATRDEIGKQRTKPEADALASEILGKVRAGADMVALIEQYSDDSSPTTPDKRFTVAADSRLIEPFLALALRLNLGEAGLVKSRFGWHIIKRIPPPPPDPLESVDILSRAPVANSTKVKHILLGWTGAHSEDPRGASRTRPQLEQLLKATLARLAKKKATFEALMAELSEDPGSVKTGVSYDASPDAGLVKPFLDLSLRLNVGEIGVVKTEYGLHIIKRVE